jgi:hypothetical protein
LCHGDRHSGRELLSVALVIVNHCEELPLMPRLGVSSPMMIAISPAHQAEKHGDRPAASPTRRLDRIARARLLALITSAAHAMFTVIRASASAALRPARRIVGRCAHGAGGGVLRDLACRRRSGRPDAATVVMDSAVLDCVSPIGLGSLLKFSAS